MEYIGNKKKQGSIVELLRDEILAGNIPDGSEMTQNELAESLGVSRMPVREALILLEYQGLIDRLPNNHVRVASLTEDYFRHILKTGCRLELEFLQNLEEEERSSLEFSQGDLAQLPLQSFQKKSGDDNGDLPLFCYIQTEPGRCLGKCPGENRGRDLIK